MQFQGVRSINPKKTVIQLDLVDRILLDHIERPTHIFVAGDLLFIKTNHGQVSVYDAAAKKKTAILPFDLHQSLNLQFATDGSHVYFCGPATLTLDEKDVVLFEEKKAENPYREIVRVNKTLRELNIRPPLESKDNERIAVRQAITSLPLRLFKRDLEIWDEGRLVRQNPVFLSRSVYGANREMSLYSQDGHVFAYFPISEEALHQGEDPGEFVLKEGKLVNLPEQTHGEPEDLAEVCISDSRTAPRGLLANNFFNDESRDLDIVFRGNVGREPTQIVDSYCVGTTVWALHQADFDDRTDGGREINLPPQILKYDASLKNLATKR